MQSDANIPDRSDRPPQVAWILWLSLLGSLMIYAVVGFFIRSQGQMAEPSDQLSILTPILGLLAISTTAFIFILGRVLARSAQYLQYCLVRWALSESIAVYGLVLFFLGASWAVFGAFLAWSLVLMALLAPSNNAFQKFQDAKRNAA